VRHLFARLTDPELETFLDAMRSDGVQRAIRDTARFNWHGDFIWALLGQSGVKSTLFQAVFR
jgi:hypothetical protein